MDQLNQHSTQIENQSASIHDRLLESENHCWKEILKGEREKPYFCKLLEYINLQRQSGKIIYPPASEVFNALKFTEFNQLKVVILGQDPYHGPGQAHGLCFSVRKGVPPPPSLVNIFKEMHQDLGIERPKHGCLQAWAAQGVLLLNTVLTVEQSRPQSHANLGWEQFTDRVIQEINRHKKNVIFLLWGSPAQKKGSIVDTNRHHILKAPHPSPLSAHRGFFGCKHFSKTNQLLKAHGLSEIDWRLPEG